MTKAEKSFVRGVLQYRPGKHEVCKDAFAYDRIVMWYRDHLKALLAIQKNTR